jgi:hypothetical protein
LPQLEKIRDGCDYALTLSLFFEAKGSPPEYLISCCQSNHAKQVTMAAEAACMPPSSRISLPTTIGSNGRRLADSVRRV